MARPAFEIDELVVGGEAEPVDERTEGDREHELPRLEVSRVGEERDELAGENRRPDAGEPAERQTPK